MYQRIVVGTDGSDRSMAAVEHAARLAEATGAELHVVQGCGSKIVVSPYAGDMAGVQLSEVMAAVEEYQASLRDRLSESGLTVQSHVVPEGGADALLHVATSIDADVIVVGNRGMTGVGRLLGSVPNTVAHHAPCAVLIVPTE